MDTCVAGVAGISGNGRGRGKRKGSREGRGTPAIGTPLFSDYRRLEPSPECLSNPVILISARKLLGNLKNATSNAEASLVANLVGESILVPLMPQKPEISQLA